MVYIFADFIWKLRKTVLLVVDIDVRIANRGLDEEILVCFTVKLICFNLKVSWYFDLC